MGSYIGKPQSPTADTGRPVAARDPREQLREKLSRPNHAVYTPNRRLSFAGEPPGTVGKFTITPQRHYPLQQPGVTSVGVLPPVRWDSFRKKNVLSPRNAPAVHSPVTVKIARPDHYSSPSLDHLSGAVLPSAPVDPCSRESVLKVLKERRKRVEEDEDKSFTNEQRSKRRQPVVTEKIPACSGASLIPESCHSEPGGLLYPYNVRASLPGANHSGGYSRRKRRNDSGGSAHSAFGPLLPNGAPTQLVPKRGSLMKGMTSLMEESIVKRSRTSSISSGSGVHSPRGTASTCRNPIQSSYSSSLGLNLAKKRSAPSSPLSSPGSSRCQTPDGASKRFREEDGQSPSSASSVRSDQAATVKAPETSKLTPVSKVPVTTSTDSTGSMGKRKRKIMLLSSQWDDDHISLPPPPELGYTITVKDLDEEKKAGISKFQKVLETPDPEPEKFVSPPATTSTLPPSSTGSTTATTLSSLLAAPLSTTSSPAIPVINLDPSPVTSVSTAPVASNPLLDELKRQSSFPLSTTSAKNTTTVSASTTPVQPSGLNLNVSASLSPLTAVAQSTTLGPLLTPAAQSKPPSAGVEQPSAFTLLSQVSEASSTSLPAAGATMFGLASQNSNPIASSVSNPFTTAAPASSSGSVSETKPLLASGFKPIFAVTNTTTTSSSSATPTPESKPIFGGLATGAAFGQLPSLTTTNPAGTVPASSTLSVFGGSTGSTTVAPSVFPSMTSTTGTAFNGSVTATQTTAQPAAPSLFGNWSASSATNTSTSVTAAPTTASNSGNFTFGATQPDLQATNKNVFAFGQTAPNQNTTKASFAGFSMGTMASTTAGATTTQSSFTLNSSFTAPAVPPTFSSSAAALPATFSSPAAAPPTFSSSAAAPPTFGSSAAAAPPTFSSSAAAAPPTFGSSAATAPPTFGSSAAAAPPTFGSSAAAAPPTFGSSAAAAPPTFGSSAAAAPPTFGSSAAAAPPTFGSSAAAAPPTFGSSAAAAAPPTFSSSAAAPPTFSSSAAAAPPNPFTFGGSVESTTSASNPTQAPFTFATAPATTAIVTAGAPATTQSNFTMKSSFSATAAPSIFSSSTAAPPNPFAFGGGIESTAAVSNPNPARFTFAPAPATTATVTAGAAATTQSNFTLKKSSLAAPPSYSASSAAPPNPFAFGGSVESTTSASNSTPGPFKFGAAAVTTAATFGTVAQPAFGAGPTGFAFGGTTAPSAAPSATPSFGAASQTQSSSSSATFTFGGAAPQQAPAGPAQPATSGFNFGASMPCPQFGAPVSNTPAPQMGSFNFGSATPDKPAFGASTPSFGQSAAAGPIPFGGPGTPVQGFNPVPFGSPATPGFSIGAGSKPSGARQRLQARRQHNRKK